MFLNTMVQHNVKFQCKRQILVQPLSVKCGLQGADVQIGHIYLAVCAPGVRLPIASHLLIESMCIEKQPESQPNQLR